MRSARHPRVFLAPLLCFIFACASTPKETVSVSLLSLEPGDAEEDGLGLAVKEKSTLAYLETIENSPNVKAVTRVTQNENEDLQVGPPVLSPVSNDLVYRIYVEDDAGDLHSNIWHQAENSSARTRITVGNWIDDSPCFTPDEQSIIFASNRTGRASGLWRIRARGSGGITRITSSTAADFAPSVSPDGVTIAYASLLKSAQASQIWTTESSGSMVTQLREGNQPKISPDGERILFVRPDVESGKYQIWVMSMDGSQETQLTFDAEHDHIHPAWSPDGKQIVYASDEGRDAHKRRNFDIWMMSADGGQPTSLTTNGSWDDAPCWNHTGDMIYFRSNRGGWWNIWRFELNQS